MLLKNKNSSKWKLLFYCDYLLPSFPLLTRNCWLGAWKDLPHIHPKSCFLLFLDQKLVFFWYQLVNLTLFHYISPTYWNLPQTISSYLSLCLLIWISHSILLVLFLYWHQNLSLSNFFHYLSDHKQTNNSDIRLRHFGVLIYPLSNIRVFGLHIIPSLVPIDHLLLLWNHRETKKNGRKRMFFFCHLGHIEGFDFLSFSHIFWILISFLFS